jgi:YgiT-type zinc finger domain-containing protein
MSLRSTNGKQISKREKPMNEQRCMYCHGHLELRRVNRLQQYQGRWVIIENLPTLVCTQCGEHYYTPQTHDLVVSLIRGFTQPERTELINIYNAASIAYA